MDEFFPGLYQPLLIHIRVKVQTFFARPPSGMGPWIAFWPKDEKKY